MVFKNAKQKTRHYQPKPGKTVCERVKLTAGRPTIRKNKEKPAISQHSKTITKTRIHGPSLSYWPPVRKWTYRLDDTIPSDLIRLPWADPPEYMDRQTLRGVA